MAKIVIVDDSILILKLLNSILKAENHSVWSYKNTSNLENELSSILPDLILLDVNMPDRNGYDVLRSLKNQDNLKDIPVIFVSAKDEESDIKWALMQGAANYITKPFTPKSIISAISPCLRNSEIESKKSLLSKLLIETYGQTANAMLPKLNDCQTEDEIFAHIKQTCNFITTYEDTNKSKADDFLYKARAILEKEPSSI